MKKILGYLAIAGLVIVASPTPRAHALSLINPGAAAAITLDQSANAVTEVRWHRYYRRHYRRHYGYRHYGYRRHYWHRRYFRLF